MIGSRQAQRRKTGIIVNTPISAWRASRPQQGEGTQESPGKGEETGKLKGLELTGLSTEGEETELRTWYTLTRKTLGTGREPTEDRIDKTLELSQGGSCLHPCQWG